jgi:DNA polymerase-3 subunit delta'
MVQDTLKNNQELIYKLLHNALTNKCLAHAYLFVGDNSELQKDTAFLLAQSIIEGNNDFANETTDLSQRIKRNGYADILYFDGGIKGNVGVDEIRYIVREFQKTALEKAAKKIYIVNNFDSINNVAANAFLKFIEEPTKNTYGIIIVNNKDNVIDTIKSRCQVVNFKSSNFEQLYKKFSDADLNNFDKYMMSRLKISDIKIAEDECYQTGYAVFMEYLKKDSFDDFIFYIFNSYYINFKSLKEKDLMKTMLISSSQYFLRMLVVFYTDILSNDIQVSDSYDRALMNFRSKNLNISLLKEIILDTLKELDYRPFSHNLTIDKMLYRLKKGEIK